MKQPVDAPNTAIPGLQLTGILLILASLLLLSAAGIAADPVKPNLVFILADDLGYGEVGCYGQQIIQTPQLDRMAAEGLRFTHFYAGATVCAPSRSVLMTGQHHGRTRVRGNAGRTNPKAQALLPEDFTVADLLQQHGYRTSLVGKWGLGDIGAAESGLPRKHGFDEFFGYLNQRHAHNHFPDFLWQNEERFPLPNVIHPVGDQGAGYATKAVQFADDLFADRALKFVEDNQERPFFLYWSMVIPHANNERRRELGNGAQVPDFGPYADRDWPDPDKGHAAMITRMDGMVGQLLDRLQQLEIADRTLVIFTSDNGPHRESGHQLERFQPSGPYSGIKRSLMDGGIRVPTLAWWPGQIVPGRTSDHVGYFGDLMATAADLSDAAVPANVDSISLMPTLMGQIGQQQRHEFLYWEFHEGGFQQACLYQGRWKAIRRLGQPVRLFDTDADLAEQQNVASLYPQVAQICGEWLDDARTPAKDWEPKPGKN